jgi:hypothetical protein
MIRSILAALYIVLGIAIFTTLVPILILITGLAQNSGGIEFSSSDGVHILRFKSDPGNLILIAHSTTYGDKAITFLDDGKAKRGGGTHFEWSNPWFSLIFSFLFVFISTPLLKRILFSKKEIEQGAAPN